MRPCADKLLKPRASGIAACRRPARSVTCKSLADAELQTPAAGSAPGKAAAVGQQRKRAVLAAQLSGFQDVQEMQRPLSEYMSLPASQYSVLDARKIERISDTMFKCYVGELNLISWTAEPVLTVSVTVEPEEQGCTIRLLSCTLRGSKFVEDINDKFDAKMTNVVRWRAASAGTTGQAKQSPAHTDAVSRTSKQIVSTTSLRVELEIPGWCSFLPASTIEKTGSGVLQNVLNAMVPRFLAQLNNDYKLWAAGNGLRAVNGQL